MESINKQHFAQMVVIDYLLSNTDRHLENFGFLVDNRTNTIIDMAPLYDHNQALIADVLGNNVSDLLYEPTGLSLSDSARKYFADAGITINWEIFRNKELFLFDGVELTLERKYKDLWNSVGSPTGLCCNNGEIGTVVKVMKGLT